MIAEKETAVASGWTLTRPDGKESIHGSFLAAKCTASKHRRDADDIDREEYHIAGPNGERLTGSIGWQKSRTGRNRIEWNEK